MQVGLVLDTQYTIVYSSVTTHFLGFFLKMSFLVTILCRGCIVVVASRSSVVVVFHRGNNVLSSLCDFNKFILPSS